MKSSILNLTIILILITFISSDINAQLSVVGEPEILIASDDFKYMKPTWSPDGNSIAYTSARNSGIWVTDISGENRRLVTDETAGFGFAWSQDSESILARVSTYENRRRKHAITVFNVISSDLRRITEFRNEMPSIPKWTNADQSIVLITDNKVESFESGLEIPVEARKFVNQRFYVLKSGSIASGMIPENSIADISPFDNADYINLEISPDGKKLAFEVYGGNLYVMNIDGTGLRDLGRANRPKWSPNGDYIIAMVATDNGHNYQTSDILAFDVVNNAQYNLTAATDLIATNPTWSPSGTRIAFDSPETGNIYLLSISNQ
jgi:Tol biopolymer transport system component